MRNSENYLRNIEEVRIGGQDITIEHSQLENILGFGLVVATVTSPIWITYGLYSDGKYGYNKFKENNVKKE